MDVLRRKVVVVGDKGTGKTSLITTFQKDCFQNEVPDLCRSFTTEMIIHNRHVAVKVLDSNDTNVRYLCYPNADVIVICFGIDSFNSLESVATKWAPEIRNYCGNAPIILVGNKEDYRVYLRASDRNQREIVSSHQGHEMYRRIGAFAYVECSARYKRGVTEVFRKACEATLQIRRCEML